MAKKKKIIDIAAPKIVLEQVAKDDNHYIHCRILIICEGEKTEPNYFKSFQLIKNSSSFVFDITTDGGGINTLDVVKEAIRLRDEAEKNGKPFDSVWAVFDRDSFDPNKFDDAINKASQKGINCAWSNEAFELWYVYHFDNRSTPMSRKDYKGIITKRVRSKGIKEFTYKKNDPKMREVLSRCGCDERLSIKYAKQQAETFTNKRYHDHNPCTTVYKLVQLLIGEDNEFNKQIEKRLH